MATVTISGKFGNDADLARRTMVFAPLNSPFGSGDELVCGPEFSVSLDASGDASLTMLEGNYLVWLKDIPDQVATIAVPSGAGTHNINSIFATSTTAGLNSVSTGDLDYLDRTGAPSNPPIGYYKLYFRGGTVYKLNSAGSETPIAGDSSGDMVGPASSTSGNLPSFDGTGGKTLQDSGIASADVYSSGGTDVPVVDGGTGASTASGARTNLGLGTSSTLDVPAAGDAASGEVVKGDDTRLTDSRTPTSHNHAASEISDSTAAGRTLLTAANVTAQQTALNVEDGADVTDATNVDAAGAVMNSDASTAAMSFVVDEDNMASDSATKLPTQQSVKAYVDANTGGASLPVDDTTAIAQDPVDNTKLVRLDVGAVTTGTTRTVTIPDRDVDLSSGGTFAENSHNHAASEISDSTAAGRTLLTAANVTAQQTALNVEDGADVTDATNVDAAGAVMNSDASTAAMSFVVDEDNMASDSATKLPTQQSVKAYVDANAGAHASNHVLGGSDEIDGDQLDIDYTAGNYTPATTGVSPNVAHLSSHLNGIDNEIAAHASDIYTNSMDISDHTYDSSNPHSVTNDQVGLGNVENTALSTWAGTSNITTVGTVTSGNVDAVVSAASTTAAGKVEIATTAETDTGTDTGRAITPDGLAGSIYGRKTLLILVTDPNGDALTTGDGKAYFRIPNDFDGMNLVDIEAAVTTVSSSGLPTVQIHNVTDTVDMLSTSLTIDASEKDSSTATTAAVINGLNDDVIAGDQIRIDVDTAGTGTKGLMVELIFETP